MIAGLYGLATRLVTPLLPILLKRRLAADKEDPARWREKLGLTDLPRPDGPLLWVHAASVGESMSMLPLVTAIRAERPDLGILVTTGTRTSATLMGGRLPPGCLHQYVPLDGPKIIDRFLDHWRPDAGFFVESELWPNLIRQSAARGIPLALVNARMSEKSFANWRRFGIGRMVIGPFTVCLAQDEDVAEMLRTLGGRDVRVPGNLKQAALPLPADGNDLAALRSAIGNRPCWVAASTHDPEEMMAARAHRAIALHHPDLLTIIAPRHPGRGPAIADAIAALGLSVMRRAAGEAPGAATEVYVADTMGELGLWYRLAPVAFTGGSLIAHGGQNPLEPARLGTAIVHGPHVFNFTGTYAALDAAGGARGLADEAALAEVVSSLLADADTRARMTAAAAAFVADGDGVLTRTLDALRPLLPPPRPGVLR